MITIPVNVPAAAYEVLVQPGLIASIGSRLKDLLGCRRAAIVTDSNLAGTHLSTLQQSLSGAGLDALAVTIPAGESHKTLETLNSIYDELLAGRIERSTPVLALGGGVVGDLAGFAAATLLRGVPFVQVPTSLLAMVDASVGGKTGVNHSRGKNLIGAFHQPRAVFIDPEVLRTLPPRELRSGLAECIKHDLICDAEGFAKLEQNIGRALELDIDYLTDLVAHNVAIKARVVEADPFEQGERAHLNFGHTFGHAIETVSNYAYSHGECIALGMVAAARVANALDMIDAPSVNRIATVIGRAELPAKGERRTEWVEPVLDAMLSDKKVAGGRVRFVLPARIGGVTVRDDVPPELVRRAVEFLFG